jgi:hypothetical protein
MMLVNRQKRGFTVGHGNDFMAVGGEQFLVEHADALGVIGDEHATAAGRWGQ